MRADSTIPKAPDAARHATVFHARGALMLFTPPLLAMTMYVMLWPPLAVLSGLSVRWADLAQTAGSCGLGVLIVNAAVGRQRGRYWSWFRISDAGIEIGARRAGVFIDWEDILSAQVRRPGLLAVLEIVPRNLYALRVELPSRDLPRIRYSGGQPVLTVDAGYFRPGLDELRAALRRHAR
ncbi:hypothetical protein [Krasilnikovia sp. MM14-A1259]|uniref:hypothetical protein n=1 Tax=Krasilnikovia sp. MM14-A1259 TaxID=3373539 RepID=UPI0038116E11